MKLKHLISYLQEIDTFNKPKIEYEQYPTSAYLAGQMLYTIHNIYNEIENHVVCDLGIGCGMLTMASIMLGSAYNIAYDIDIDAINQAKTTLMEYDVLNQVDIIQANLIDIYQAYGGTFIEKKNKKFNNKKFNNKKFKNKNNKKNNLEEKLIEQDDLNFRILLKNSCNKIIDTVITNPPFGTRKAGIDLLFIKVGLLLAKKSVYSLHKTSTRAYLINKAKQWNINIEIIAQMKFDIPKLYNFHTNKTKDIQVDFIRFSHHQK